MGSNSFGSSLAPTWFENQNWFISNYSTGYIYKLPAILYIFQVHGDDPCLWVYCQILKEVNFIDIAFIAEVTYLTDRIAVVFKGQCLGTDNASLGSISDSSSLDFVSL